MAPTESVSTTAHGGVVEVIANDLKSGEPLTGVTILVWSTSLPRPQTMITDERGTCAAGDLPDGDYSIYAYFADLTLPRDGIRIDHASGTLLKLAIDAGVRAPTPPRNEALLDR